MSIPREKTELENYIVYGIDLKNRRIFFGHPTDWGHLDEEGDVGYNDFTEASVEIAVRAIKRMEKDHPKHVIEIYVNSCGGDYKSMLYLHDVIEASPCKFVFYGGGRVNSSATWIMAVCDERYLYKNTTVLLHNGRSGYNAPMTTSYDDNLIDVEYEKEETHRLNSIYADNSHMPLEFWNDILKRDLKISAQHAITLGLVDFIVPLTKRGNLRRKRDAQMANRPHHNTLKSLVSKLYNAVGINPPNKPIEIHIHQPAEADPEITVDETPLQDET